MSLIIALVWAFLYVAAPRLLMKENITNVPDKYVNTCAMIKLGVGGNNNFLMGMQVAYPYLKASVIFN